MKIRFAAAVIALAAAALITPIAHAQTFVFGKSGNDAQQVATVESVADFETFTGHTQKVSGTVTIDRAKHTGKGFIAVDAASIDTGIPLRNTHLQSPYWLDTAKNPEIRFEVLSIKPVKGDTYRATGNFTLHGVTKPVTALVEAKYLPASDLTKKAGFAGDVLHLKTTFPITLSDYGITIPAQAAGKVAPTVKISLSAFGQTGA